MEITNSTTASTTATSSTASASSPTLGYNAFLQLLIAQMQNQDPTDPMDSAEYMGQLASFSAVEQAVETNAKLDMLMTSTALSQADSLIGHTIASEDGGVSGRIVSLRIISGGAVAVLENGDELALGAGVTIS